MAGITAYGKELRPRLRMESPLDKIQGFLSEQITIPKNVFGGLDHEKNERQSSTNIVSGFSISKNFPRDIDDP